MFLLFWVLNNHSFSISMRFCSFIGRPLACCACFCSSVCSITTPLTFPCVFLVYWPSFSWLCMFLLFLVLNKHSFSVSIPFCSFISRPLAGCACFRAFGGSIRTAFHFSVFFLIYWPSFTWLCMFTRFWMLNKHSFSVSQRF